MRKIDTLRFGQVEVEDSAIISFPEGIPAFEEEKEFFVVPYDEESQYVFLQSAATPELAFLMTDPFSFFPDYTFELEDEVVRQLELGTMEDVMVCSLITVPKTGVKDMTTNLLAPIVINKHTMQARQVVLERTQYTTKHRLFPPQKEE